MSKWLATAVLAVAALGLPAPAARADAPVYNCRIRTVQVQEVTGTSFKGVLVGADVHPGAVWLRCRVTVDHVTVAEATGSGEHVAVVAKDISFVADDTAFVRVCADYANDQGSGTMCYVVGQAPLPPPEVWHALDTLLPVVWGIVDPPVCSVLQALAPGVGPVYINGQGDVYVDGEPQWDCPPFDVVWG